MDKDQNVNMTKNQSRRGNSIYQGLLHKKKFVNKISVFLELSQHRLPNSSQVYILYNDKETDGVNIFYKFFFDYLGSNVNKKEEYRNGSDAICVVAIILDLKDWAFF